MRRVFVEFAKHVFSEKIEKNDLRTLGDSGIPFYDRMHKIISDDIGKLNLPKPVLVSWLTDVEKKKAQKELKNYQSPDIASLKDSFEKVDHKYPKVDFDYFK